MKNFISIEGSLTILETSKRHNGACSKFHEQTCPKWTQGAPSVYAKHAEAAGDLMDEISSGT